MLQCMGVGRSAQLVVKEKKKKKRRKGKLCENIHELATLSR